MSSRIGALVVLSILTGCAGKVDVVRTVSPSEARQSGLRSTAIVRGEDRIPLPADARLETSRVVIPQREPLGPEDVIQQDALGRIVAIRKADGHAVRFVPGSATFVPGRDEVRGEVEGEASSAIALQPEDRIEVRGTFEADDRLPGGATLEHRRGTGFLIAGATVTTLAYAPSVYVGATSPNSADRALFVPVAGPFIALAQRRACEPPQGSELIPVDPCLEEKASRGALLTSGAIQAIGAMLFVLGLPSRPYIVEPPQVAKPSIRVLPTRNGAEAVGTF